MEIDVALEVLLALHEAGDAAASASCAEILAFQGRFDEMARCAKTLLAKPDAVYAGNVVEDMKALVKLKRGSLSAPRKEAPNRARYDDAVREAPTHKRFKGRPVELASHCSPSPWSSTSTTRSSRAGTPDIRTSTSTTPSTSRARSCDARIRKRAWEVLESRLTRWYPVDAAQVLPVVLVTDALLAPLMTRERAELVLRTPRAGG